MQAYKLPPCEEFDCDLLQRVNGFLCQRGYAFHRMLKITIERGVVVVQGRVPSYYLRQVAVECIKRVAGVTQVVDLIKVANRRGQLQADGTSKDDQASLDSPMSHRIDVPDRAPAPQHTHRTDVGNYPLIPIAKG